MGSHLPYFWLLFYCCVVFPILIWILVNLIQLHTFSGVSKFLFLLVPGDGVCCQSTVIPPTYFHISHPPPDFHGSPYSTRPRQLIRNSSFVPVILPVATLPYFQDAWYCFRTWDFSAKRGSQLGLILRHSDQVHMHAVLLRCILILSFNLLSYIQSESIHPNLICTYFPHPGLSWPSVFNYN
jgi:hypothetical protein